MIKRWDKYGDQLNSYDLLKLIALATMILDHLGYYFWQDSEWLRAIGRIAFPLFLFLVGYSQKWRSNTDLIVCALAIEVTAILTHHPVFPMNMLVGIFVVRLVMERIADDEMTARFLRGIFLAAIVWYLPFYWLDYSTLALLFAMVGLLKRRQVEDKKFVLFLYATLLLHFLMQYFDFRFALPGLLLMLADIALLAWLMQGFSIRPITMALPSSLNRALQWAARNTLPIYALHLMLFMVIERLWFAERLTHFRWF